MTRNEILDELFRVQATLDHVLAVGRAGKIELQFLRLAQARQLRAIKAVAVFVPAEVALVA